MLLAHREQMTWDKGPLGQWERGVQPLQRDIPPYCVEMIAMLGLMGIKDWKKVVRLDSR